mmetsp:Transcript_20087/g.33488  ORF Transcript_20087/g.33488 Transcript_20087/m.33488 type:complete len:109 (+) Transcript_20087:40-366(+)
MNEEVVEVDLVAQFHLLPPLFKVLENVKSGTTESVAKSFQEMNQKIEDCLQLLNVLEGLELTNEQQNKIIDLIERKNAQKDEIIQSTLRSMASVLPSSKQLPENGTHF